jgi:hypothetical protein
MLANGKFVGIYIIYPLNMSWSSYRVSHMFLRLDVWHFMLYVYYSVHSKMDDALDFRQYPVSNLDRKSMYHM